MPAQEKTESATPKRRQEVRKKGQVARSQEVGTAVSLLIAWMAFKVFGQGIVGSMREMLTTNFQNINQPDFTDTGLKAMGTTNMVVFWKLLLPVAGALVLAGLISNLLQVGLHFAPGAAKPQLSRINPLSGFQRLFSLRSLEEGGKSLLKLAIVGFLAYQAINDHMTTLTNLTGNDLRGGLGVVADIGFELLLKIGLAYLVIAATDYMFQRWQFEKSIKMTKQEVKEELRSQELNEQIKSRIRSLQRALARKRMMQRVPQADVVITNPTHFAVALQYDATKMTAPKVIAKGQRLMAEQIKKIAREHGIPLVENKPLAQALYKAVDVDREIPRDLYKAVAEVLAFIYKLKQQHQARLAS
ncbi:MAG: flagellar biosynthesis protein FlhB [Chloroflexi bacterium]|nr:flagellar biosynthesis protein FlhB [Chloroflexota bacterium]